MVKRGGGHGCSKPNCENDVFSPQPYVVDLNDTEWTVDHYEKYIKQRKENRVNRVPENPRLTTFRVKELDLSGYNKGDREPFDLQLICSNFPNVEKLELSDNGLTELPDCIAYLEKLRWLDVNENPLTTLPGGFSSFDRPNGLYLLMDDITPETKEVLPDHFLINSMVNTKPKRVETYNIPSSIRSSTSGRGRGSRSTTSGRGRGRGSRRSTNQEGGSRKRKTKKRSTKRRRR